MTNLEGAGVDEIAAGGTNGSVCERAELELANGVEIELPDNHDYPGVVSGGGSRVAPALEAYKSLRRRIMNVMAEQGLRSVAITSAAPSDGKTVTAFNLAYCCAQLENVRVLLIDADLRTDALSRVFTGLPKEGLKDVLSGTTSPENAIVRTTLPNLYVMGAGDSRVAPAELLSTDKWKQCVRWASQRFDLVLVDSVPAGLVVDFDLIAAGCDGILLVVRALKTSRQTLKLALNQIEPQKMLGVVWNGSHQLRYAKNYLHKWF